MFNCEWFDPTPNIGTIVHPRYNLVDVHDKGRFNKYEPFVLAAQAAQVYYCKYPGAKRDRKDWKAVCKIKARAQIDIPETRSCDPNEQAIQNDDNDVRIEAVVGDEDILLVASYDIDEPGDVDVDVQLMDHEEEINEDELSENDVTASDGDAPNLDDFDDDDD